MTRRLMLALGLLAAVGLAVALVMRGSGNGALTGISRTIAGLASEIWPPALTTQGSSVLSDQGNPATAETRQAPSVTPRGDVTLDVRRQQLIGVRTVAVGRVSVAPVIRAVGTVRLDETRLTDVNLKIDGWIRDLLVDYTGSPVRKGQPLFTLYNPEILATQSEYLLATATRDQLARSLATDVRDHAGQLAAAARQRLALWDVPPEDLATLEETRNPQGIVTFRSPVDGIVMEKQAMKGMHATAGQTLYKVADLSVVWVEADVYENDAQGVRIGAAATVTVNAYPGETFSGKTAFIYPTVQEQTRTLKVRLALPNRAGRLKPGMFANVEFQTLARPGLVVPTDAVLDSGTDQVVFIAEGDGHFAPRHVRVGRRLRDGVEILDGLKEGEQVATGAAFFLDSESQLRASLPGYQPYAGMATSGAAASGAATAPTAAPAAERLAIALRTQPDPPRMGRNVFEVSVRDSGGAPISDADVSVGFFMAAMPTMNMPAMQNTFTVSPVGKGVYRGSGEVLSSGSWSVTVTVGRKGQRLGSTQLTVVAR